MRLVVLESPYKGNTEENVAYARRAVMDCLKRGESPIASHLLFTQPGVLKDDIAEERALGLKAGRAWIHTADAMVVYTNLGISDGMRNSITLARSLGVPVEYRVLQPLF